jgi:hypothetical protein
MEKNNSSPTTDNLTLEGITISVRNDYLFKKIFGSEDSKSAVAHLIHLTTGIRKEDVSDLTISDPHLLFRKVRDKRGIVDIHIKLKDGKRINIEMQNHWHPFYPERAIYYWSLLYQDTSRAGEGYNRLSKCIGIHLLNEAFRLSGKLQSTYAIREEDGTLLSDVLELHFFDLTKLPEETKDLLQSEITELERWLLFIRTDSQKVRNALSVRPDFFFEVVFLTSRIVFVSVFLSSSSSVFFALIVRVLRVAVLVFLADDSFSGAFSFSDSDSFTEDFTFSASFVVSGTAIFSVFLLALFFDSAASGSTFEATTASSESLATLNK